MKIERLEIHNFRAIENVVIEVVPLSWTVSPHFSPPTRRMDYRV